MSRCNHTTDQSCLRGDECAECLREKAQGSFAAPTGSADTILFIQTSDGEIFKGRTTRALALKIAEFILAVPAKAPNQRPSGEGKIPAAVGCGDSQPETVSSSIATQPSPPNDGTERQPPTASVADTKSV